MQTARRQPFGDEAAEASETRAYLEPGFERLERLGSGEYGRVWRARDRALDKEVALKVLRMPSVSGKERARLLNEARFLAALDHPNIVRIHSVLEEQGEIELCLELLSGRTLDEIVRQDGPFSAREAALIGKELCRALSAIHGRGLVHCDLKPANVMRTKDERIVLFDFGLTRRFGMGNASRTIGGTPVFLAPEVFRTGEQGPSSDLYALGVLLYYLVTGTYPIEASLLGEVCSKATAGELVPLLDRRPDLPAGFVSAVERLLACAPEERPSSAGDSEQALAQFLGQEVSARRWHGAFRGQAGLALVAALVIAGVALSTTFLLG